MELQEVYQAIINGRAILLTGSGAHMSAVRMDEKPFPSGVSLAEKLYKACGIEDPDNVADLQDAADTYLEVKSPDELISEIKKNLYVTQVKQEHKNLYTQDWQRVYTTNYDEIPILSSKESEKPLYPVTLSDDVQIERENRKQCIYINGYIGKLNKNTLQSEFKLSGRSYSAEALNDSPWSAILEDDLLNVDCVVIVGLSLEYDLDLRRIIYAKNVINKTVFIENDKISPDKQRKLRRYGVVYPIGVEAFTKDLEEYKAAHPVSQATPMIHIYKCFDVGRKKNVVKRATSLQVYDLFMTGQIENRDNLWHTKNGRYDNIVYRKALNEAKNDLKNGCKVIYLHANLGNGKTIFVECIKNILLKENYHIYTLKNVYPKLLSADIKNIVETTGKKVVIIENYYNYIEVLEKFSRYELKEIQFILTARTVLYDTRILEANTALRIGEGESRVINLNKLSDSELSFLTNILNKNGLWGRMSGLSNTEKKKQLKNKRKGNAEFQSILVDVVNSTDMKEKIEQIVLGIKSVSVSYYEVLILALLVKVMSLNISILDIEKIMGINVAFDSKFTNDKNVLEILNFSEECTDFRIKSAVTARMILQELNCNDVIIKVLGKTANYTNKYRSIERYENVLKNIISYSHVSTFLVKSSQREEFLVKYYDSLKELEYYSENTFFWLQYAIACANIGFYDLAQRFLDTAYEYFRESEYTVPFQADTQQARLYLLRIENEQRTDNTELFEKAHRLLMRPAVSSKDNEEKKIQLMKKYVDTHIRRKVQMKESTVYQVCCGEAYNMVHEFLKKPIASRNGNDYTKLEKSLLKAAASESKI